MKMRLPENVHQKHGAFYFVKRNPETHKVVWTNLGRTYPQMLGALSNQLSDEPKHMRDIFARYQADILPTKSQSTQRNQGYQIEYLNEHFGDRIPSSITTQEIYKYHDMRSQVSKSSANKEMGLLSTIMRFAIRWGDVTTSPAENLQRNQEMPRTRFPSDVEYKLLLDNSNGFLRDAIEILYLTGQRIGDILKAEWADIQNGYLHVVQKKHHRDKPPTVLDIEITPTLNAAIQRCKDKQIVGRTLICDARGQPVLYSNINKRFTALVEKLNIQPKLTLHDLRRKAGKDAGMTSQLLGNTQQVRERHYNPGVKVVKPVR